jgi:hypothetical protein
VRCITHICAFTPHNSTLTAHTPSFIIIFLKLTSRLSFVSQVEAITKLEERAAKSESSQQFAVVNDLAKVLAKKVDEDDM